MEIERKFLIDGFPAEFPPISAAYVEQGYLCTDPTVRIRLKRTEGKESYKLCFKGDGTLVRQEIELNITGEVYGRLKALLKAPVIVKDFRVYRLPDGHELECSHVDPGRDTAFYYAEVEFDSVDEAGTFAPPPFLGREVTEERSYAMAAYWDRKLKAGTDGDKG